MVHRAEAVGYSTLMLTADVAVNGNRERDLRNTFGLPVRYTPRLIYDGVTHPRWSLGFVLNGMPQLGNFVTTNSSNVEMQATVMHRQMDASFTWDDFNWLRKLWPHMLLVKGIMRPDDTERCIAAGADGVILSNHGGRQFDAAVSPLDVLAESRARTSAPILIDSGFRRGTDIVKALALGAVLYICRIFESFLHVQCPKLNEARRSVGPNGVSRRGIPNTGVKVHFPEGFLPMAGFEPARVS
jgi:(S)-mandelate dehydrogenase